MKILAVALICLLSIITSEGEVITVDDDGPADFNNIQEAINYSQDGDIIVVEFGTYYENVLFNNKAVTLTSKNPDDPSVVGSTIIAAISSYSINFDSNEVDDSVLTGFTITGRGVYCYS